MTWKEAGSDLEGSSDADGHCVSAIRKQEVMWEEVGSDIEESSDADGPCLSACCRGIQGRRK